MKKLMIVGLVAAGVAAFFALGLGEYLTLDYLKSAHGKAVEFTRASTNGPRILELSAANRVDCSAAELTLSQFVPCLLGPRRPLGAGCYCGDGDDNGTVDLRDIAQIQASQE